MDLHADSIASVVLEEFKKLPAKRKPAVRDNGIREWVPLSSIVVEGPNGLKCVALATGMKCLPASKLAQSRGIALHDWHAEVLVIRAFNRLILDECRRLAQDSSATSEYLRRRTPDELSQTPEDGPWHQQPFTWREELILHMYCSEAPCGDASMELIMSSQDDATPWDIPPPPQPPSPSQSPSPPPQTPSPTPLLGRGYFSQLGIVRRKPSRADAPPTLSKSCSDKLALKQCTSLLNSLVSLFVSPENVYLATLVLPASQFSEEGCRRCFGEGGRMAGVVVVEGRARDWEGGGYGFWPFRVEVVSGGEFGFSRRGIEEAAAAAAAADGDEGGSKVKMVASNLAVAWTAGGEVEEGLIGGVLQGRKAFDLKGASLTSRRRMWEAAVEVAEMMGDEGILRELRTERYDGVKESASLEARRRVKETVRGEALKGWIRNTGDGEFGL
ncbi:adenosine deaminase/editase [Dichotomopilus funicola]|uniref:Adenosine deaminase/editase n=1 Tax=Dichotomopilus funicola TaxID=1934379 RepID=A0AAN6ZI96_9PEZI|nr:adenosine deaminase/editase [Dichotomopilus funicola]